MAQQTERMKDLVRLIRNGKDSLDTYEIKAIMRSTIAEVVSTNPEMLYKQLTESLAETCNLMCERAASYVIDRIIKRKDISEETKDIYVTESKVNWSKFAVTLRKHVESQLPQLEEIIFDKIFTFQPELFQMGYIRLPHQQDLDCTDLEGARQLGVEVTHNEKRLAEALQKRNTLRKRKAMLQKAKEEIYNVADQYHIFKKECGENMEEINSLVADIDMLIKEKQSQDN